VQTNKVPESRRSELSLASLPGPNVQVAESLQRSKIVQQDKYIAFPRSCESRDPIVATGQGRKLHVDVVVQVQARASTYSRQRDLLIQTPIRALFFHSLPLPPAQSLFLRSVIRPMCMRRCAFMNHTTLLRRYGPTTPGEGTRDRTRNPSAATAGGN
jgi:hypothetical protein